MVGRAIMLAAVAAQTVTCFLPWVRTGQRERNAFELVDAARTLDVLDSGVLRGLALALYLVPLAATLCWLAVLLHRQRVAAGLAVGMGLFGIVISFSLEQTAITSLQGVRATLVTALAVILGATLDLMEGGRHELAHEP